MVRIAKLFRMGRNRAVRIPRELEVAGDVIFVIRRAEQLILSTRPGDWSGLLESKKLATDDFLRRDLLGGL